MSPGESKSTTIPPEKAYGPRHEQMVQVIDREQVPPDLKLEVAQQLEVRRPEGQTILVTVGTDLWNKDESSSIGNFKLRTQRKIYFS